jgi:hypothetical protein
MRCAALLLVVLFGVLLAGCGTSGDRRGARAAVERFNAALERRDGRGACDELTEGAAAKLESSEKKPCDQAILSLELDPSGVANVEVFVTSGRADLTSGGATFLDETSQGWKIAALGCEPRPEQPYECELEA